MIGSVIVIGSCCALCITFSITFREGHRFEDAACYRDIMYKYRGKTPRSLRGVDVKIILL